MASKKTPTAQDSLATRGEKIEALGAVLESEGVSAFAGMVSLSACDLLAQQAVRKKHPDAPLDAHPDIQRAWAMMATPEGASLMGLLHVDEDTGLLFRPDAPTGNGEPRDEGQAEQTIAAGYAPEQIQALCSATRAASALIEQAAGTEAFAAAARAYAALAGKKNADGSFGYPLLGVALKPSNTKLDGKLSPTVAAGTMPSSNEWSAEYKKLSRQKAHQSTAELATIAGLLALDAEQGASNLTDWETRRVFSDRLFRSEGRLDTGSLAAKAEDDLPSIEMLQTELAERSKAPGIAIESQINFSAHVIGTTWATSSNQRALNAAAILASHANAAISRLIRPKASELELSTDRQWRNGIDSGPLAQAFPKKRTQAELGVASSMLMSLRAYRALGLDRLVPENGDDNDVEEHPPSALNIGEALAAASRTPEKLPELWKRAASFKNADPAIEEILSDYWGICSDSEEFDNFESKTKFKEPVFNNRPGIDGLAHALAEASPVLGICQWATSASLAIHEDNYELAPIEASKIGHPDQRELLAALETFKATLAQAQIRFASIVCETAKIQQDAWLAERGLLDAWTQASLSGQITPRAVAWARLNLNPEATSRDPIERMAAGAARGLGLGRATAAPPAPAQDGASGPQPPSLVERMRLEFAQQGIADHGWRLLAQSSECRSYAMQFLSRFNAKNSNESTLAKQRWPMAAKAIEAAGRAGLDGPEASKFCETICPPTEDLPSYRNSALIDGFAATFIEGPGQARLAAELAHAKRLRLQSAFDALALDWKICLEEGAKLGVQPQAAQRARERGALLARCAHRAAQLDWRKNPFESGEAWKVFGLTSHRLDAVIEKAKLGSPLEAWAARCADKLGILDAADANSLVSQAKEACKRRWGMSEGAWKLSIKSTETLAALGKSIEESARDADDEQAASRYNLSQADSKALRGEDQSETQQERMFFAAGLAAAQGASSETFADVLHVLETRAESSALFSRSIGSHQAADMEAAFFYEAESSAKTSRMPKIFQEMCKRRQKLDADHQSAAKEGRQNTLPAREALAGEVADLCDWLAGSEHGIWQNLPQEPTWGQLRRLSADWHQEQHAIELDRISREKAKYAEEREAHKLDPFAPRATEHWEPILGLHKRDGWEAVELTSQSQLTDEGKAMHHCVSSYSSYCREGNLRIFSIRLDGERKCTMEIRSDKDLRHLDENAVFRITQNKGKHNAEVVSPATREFCKETLADIHRAWKAKHDETMELRRLDAEKKEAAKKAAAELRKAEAAAAKKANIAEPAAPSSETPRSAGKAKKPKA